MSEKLGRFLYKVVLIGYDPIKISKQRHVSGFIPAAYPGQ